MATQQLIRLQQINQQAAFMAVVLYRRIRQRRRRRYWIRPWIARRPQFGDFENLMAELERESQGDFVAYLRMEPAMFHELVQRLTPRLTKQDTNWRKSLNPGLKIAVTLRYRWAAASPRHQKLVSEVWKPCFALEPPFYFVRLSEPCCLFESYRQNDFRTLTVFIVAGAVIVQWFLTPVYSLSATSCRSIADQSPTYQ